jgi:hypothetical protein
MGSHRSRRMRGGWQRWTRAPISLDQIAYWATRSPYNAGIATGYRGVVVIDVETDVPEIRAALDAALHADYHKVVSKLGNADGAATRDFSATHR